VLLIDIADEQSPEELMEQILHSWWWANEWKTKINWKRKRTTF
jgi:hypothetical protein